MVLNGKGTCKLVQSITTLLTDTGTLDYAQLTVLDKSILQLELKQVLFIAEGSEGDVATVYKFDAFDVTTV